MADAERVRQFLDQYPPSLKMTKICEPVVTYYEAPDAADSGVSGFVIIAESHISIHTFPQRSYINIDIFSCKDFDDQRALQDVQDFFGLKRVKRWVLQRGLEHLNSEEATVVIPEERTRIGARFHS